MKQVTEHFKKTVAPWGEAWKNISRVLFLFLLITAATVGLQTLTSCELLGIKDDDTLYGVWKAVGTPFVDGYEIWYEPSKDKSYIKYNPYIDPDYPFDSSFVGEIQSNSTSLLEQTGYIYFKVVEVGQNLPSSLIGKYSATHWKDFAGNTVKMSNAYKEGGQNDGMSTAQQAAQEYTVENGYFAYYGDYQRQ